MFKRELYSEILDHKFTIKVTARTLDLIDAAYGFDFYILKVRGHHLCPTKKDISYRAFYKIVNIQLLSDTKGRPELQVGDGPEEGYVAPPGTQRQRALPR